MPDDALCRLVLTGPPAVRRRVYGVLRRSRRRRPADELLAAARVPELTRAGGV